MSVKMAFAESDLDYRYYAGFFDGEGSVGIYFRNRNKLGTLRYGVLVVTLAQNGVLGYRVMKPLKDAFGGSLLETVCQNGKSMWKWHISASKAEVFLRKVLPHLFVKKDQVKLCLDFQELSDKSSFNNEAAELALAVRSLKQTGDFYEN